MQRLASVHEVWEMPRDVLAEDKEQTCAHSPLLPAGRGGPHAVLAVAWGREERRGGAAGSRGRSSRGVRGGGGRGRGQGVSAELSTLLLLLWGSGRGRSQGQRPRAVLRLASQRGGVA
jgi:hypothetical protein